MKCDVFDVCKNDGICYKFAGRDNLFCKCLPPWTGEICNITYCDSNPCKNSATCVPSEDSYSCICDSAFTGSDCSQDVDECRVSNNGVLVSPCYYTQICVNSFGSFSCECHVGFEGFNCLVNINDCLSAPCPDSSTCVDGVAGYTCVWPPEYNKQSSIGQDLDAEGSKSDYV